MNTLQIGYFLAVAECLNFTKAAHITYTSQPNISKQISLMEQELGFQLFVRTTQSVELTTAGEILCKELKIIFNQLTNAIERAADASINTEYKFRIGVSQYLDMSVVNPAIKRFKEKYPLSDVFVESVDFKTLRNKLTQGQYDIALTIEKALIELDELELMCIAEHRMVLACTKEHPSLKKPAPSPADFANDTLFMLDSSETPKNNELVLDICSAYGFTPQVRVCNSLASYFLNIELGCGVAILDRSIRLPDNTGERIALIDIPEEIAVAKVVAAHNKSNTNPAVKLFLHELENM